MDHLGGKKMSMRRCNVSKKNLGLDDEITVASVP
jgi:hypothetical protein